MGSALCVIKPVWTAYGRLYSGTDILLLAGKTQSILNPRLAWECVGFVCGHAEMLLHPLGCVHTQKKPKKKTFWHLHQSTLCLSVKGGEGCNRCRCIQVQVGSTVLKSHPDSQSKDLFPWPASAAMATLRRLQSRTQRGSRMKSRTTKNTQVSPAHLKRCFHQVFSQYSVKK